MLVRALTFRKCFAQSTHQNEWWALIGHFDELEYSDLKPMTLEEIQDFHFKVAKDDSEKSYHHTIFLINAGDSGRTQEDDRSFWETRRDFLSITRIHFPQTVMLRDQYAIITEYLKDLSSKKEYADIKWRTYYTMELSDIVLVTKSPKLQVLSRWSLLATKTKLVGSAYTYFGIPGTLIDDDTPMPEMLKEDTIDFLAIRFSIKCGDVNQALHGIRNCLGMNFTTPVFRVTGNEDAIICGQNVPVENLIRLYREWYSNSCQILTTFRDIITRIGADWDVTPPPLKTACYERQGTDLVKYSIAVLNKVRNKVLNIEDLQEAQWMRPLVTLTNAMVHMSQSATLDETVYLILPGLNAFWDNILDKEQRDTSEQIFHRFSELCIHTMEYLMRAEWQLSHRPEMRPLTYDMPVFVLEYATAFLVSLSKTLTYDDCNNTKRISFFLVPSSNISVFTDELFSATVKAPGLLETTVPFSMLYDPKYLIPSLCHEMAHYFGENIRMREERYWYFLHSVAHEMRRYFFDAVSDKSDRFLEFIVHDFLDNYLQNLVNQADLTYNEKLVTFPLAGIASLIRARVQDMISMEQPEGYADLIRNYIFNPTYRGARFYGLHKLVLQDNFERFAQRLDDLTAYYRESHADLCMLYLLQLEPIDYLKTILYRWKVPNTGILFQGYACLKVSGRSLDEILNAFKDWAKFEGLAGNEYDEMCKEILSMDEHISISFSAEKYIIQYLEKCWAYFEKIKLGSKKVDNVYTPKEIYDKLLGIDSNTKYSEILEIIDLGRQGLINELSYSLQEDVDASANQD